jgi:cyclic-di-GMP phosphodiesterase TipF (flagellum assembly factor)
MIAAGASDESERMFKPAVLFVAAAMAVTAACVGVIVAFGLGFGLGEAVLSGFAALAAMAVVHLAFVRTPPAQEGRLDDLDRLVTELQSRIEMVELRLTTLDGAVGERARAATRPLVEEIAALGGLVTSIAKEVAAHDVALADLAAASQPAKPEPLRAPPQHEPPRPAAAIMRPPAPPPPAAPRPQAPEPFDPEEHDDAEASPALRPAGGLAARLALALKEDRLEIHLQPVVALPSRRVTHYEAVSRMVEADGMVLPGEFLALAAADGLLPAIDLRAIERASRVALRLGARGRSVGVFVNIAPETLADEAAFKQIAAMVEGQRELARQIVLELRQSAFDTLGPVERETLASLAERGLRFSLDRATDLAFEPRELARRGIRFVKASADRLLDPEASRDAAIHAADLAGLMSRHAIELVASHVEDEKTVPELIDMNVKAAQGFLFGVARPVRPAAPDQPAAPGARPPRSAASR